MQIPEPTTVILSIVAGSLFGFLSVPHCLGMCGPLHLAMCLSGPRKSFRTLTLFNIGRILGYTLIGLLLGLLGEQVTRFAGASEPAAANSLSVPRSCCEQMAENQTQEASEPNQAIAAQTNTDNALAVPQSCCEQPAIRPWGIY